VYDVIYSCWNADPEKRPTFGELAQKISAISLPSKQEDANYN
jgi:hypothetical protein